MTNAIFIGGEQAGVYRFGRVSNQPPVQHRVDDNGSIANPKFTSGITYANAIVLDIGHTIAHNGVIHFVVRQLVDALPIVYERTKIVAYNRLIVDKIG